MTEIDACDRAIIIDLFEQHPRFRPKHPERGDLFWSEPKGYFNWTEDAHDMDVWLDDFEASAIIQQWIMQICGMTFDSWRLLVNSAFEHAKAEAVT